MKKPSLDKKSLSVIFSLAWPTMLEQLMQTAVQYIDTAMVGVLGTLATAAVGCTSTVNWLVNGLVNAMGVGFLASISQANGAGDREKTKRYAAQSVTMTVLLGIILTAVTLSISRFVPIWMNADSSIRDMAARYFFILFLPMLFRTATSIFGTVIRAVGDTKTPMRVGISVNLLNVVLNFLMIYPTRTVSLFGSGLRIPGFGWGIEGAAIASAISFAFGGVVITLRLFKNRAVSPVGCRFAPDLSLLKKCFRISLPNLAQRLAIGFGYVLFASMINALGDISTAAHTIANTVESLFYIPGWGMQTAAATLAGNALGGGDMERLKSIKRNIVPLEVGLMVVSGGLLFIFAPRFMRIFSKDSGVIALGSTVLRMVAVSEPFYGVSIVLEGVMQGVGKTVAPMIFNGVGMWCVRILGTYIFTRLFSFGLIAAWACMIGHNTLLFVLYTLYDASGKLLPTQKLQK